MCESLRIVPFVCSKSFAVGYQSAHCVFSYLQSKEHLNDKKLRKALQLGEVKETIKDSNPDDDFL